VKSTQPALGNQHNLLWEIDTTGLDEIDATDSSAMWGSYTRARPGATAGWAAS
jgi:hypothetical protein